MTKRKAKRCSICGKPKTGSHRAHCKKCHAAYNRRWRKLHPHMGTRKRETKT